MRRRPQRRARLSALRVRAGLQPRRPAPGRVDGSGEKVGLVEFTNYRPGDITTYKTCYGLSNTVNPVNINGGPGSLYAAIEAELDIEVVISNAPGVDAVRVYQANNNVSQILPMLDQMVSDA